MSSRVWHALTPEEIVRDLSLHAAVLAGRSEVEGVVLFGSVIRGEHTARSDADVVVVVRECPLSFIDRAPIYAPTTSVLPIDTFVYTLDEVPRTPLAVRALTGGEVLFDRDGCVERLRRALGSTRPAELR